MEKTTLLDAYLSGPGTLRAAVTGMSREQLVSRPIAGKWSVLEVVCHLADTDANIAHRIKRVLSEERPVFDRVKPEPMLATQLEVVAQEGGSPHRPVTLTPQNVLGWGIDSLFSLMACGLVMYGAVMVAVMLRELGLMTEKN